MNRLYDITQAKKVFLGECFGVALDARGSDDNHVTFRLLVEDDENWFIVSGQPSSSYWLYEIADCVEQAMLWLQQNAVPDLSGYGWRFKDDDINNVHQVQA